MSSRPPYDAPDAKGLVLAPFTALRYDEAVAGPLASLTAPPYDVIDEAGVAAYEAMSPYNVVRLILPRGPDAGPQSRYRLAARRLRQWRAAGVLRPDERPALYVYEMAVGAHVQRGLVGALGLVRPEAGIVLPHEDTMAGPVGDRLALTAATETNLEPILCVYAGGGVASAAVADVGGQPPLASASTEDGVGHRVWAVTDPDVLRAVAADLHTRRAVIADGHHRYANFRAHQAERHASGAGPGPWDYGLAVLVDATAFGPEVHAIHRVAPGLPAERAVSLAAGGFAVRRLDGSPADALETLARAGKAGPAVVVSGAEGCWLLTDPAPDALARWVSPERSPAWRGLDVTVVHQVLIRGLWSLSDDETSVWYRHDAGSAEAAARESAGVALLLNPTPVEDVVAVAAAGERMPRKSTFFTPKPRTGLLIRDYADA